MDGEDVWIIKGAEEETESRGRGVSEVGGGWVYR